MSSPYRQRKDPVLCDTARQQPRLEVDGSSEEPTVAWELQVQRLLREVEDKGALGWPPALCAALPRSRTEVPPRL